jgi:hypothetical protein
MVTVSGWALPIVFASWWGSIGASRVVARDFRDWVYDRAPPLTYCGLPFCQPETGIGQSGRSTPAIMENILRSASAFAARARSRAANALRRRLSTDWMVAWNNFARLRFTIPATVLGADLISSAVLPATRLSYSASRSWSCSALLRRPGLLLANLRHSAWARFSPKSLTRFAWATSASLNVCAVHSSRSSSVRSPKLVGNPNGSNDCSRLGENPLALPPPPKLICASVCAPMSRQGIPVRKLSLSSLALSQPIPLCLLTSASAQAFGQVYSGVNSPGARKGTTSPTKGSGAHDVAHCAMSRRPMSLTPKLRSPRFRLGPSPPISGKILVLHG